MVVPVNKRKLTAERLREVLDYDRETGAFTWKKPTALWIKPGDVAGTPLKDGYLRICIDGDKVLAHRLAWLYVTGDWPTQLVDHVNGDNADNRFTNLREATPEQSNFNRRAWGASAYKGVSWVESHGKWVAAIQVGKKRVHLGFFDTEVDAGNAYEAAARDLQGEYRRAA